MNFSSGFLNLGAISKKSTPGNSPEFDFLSELE